MTVEQRDVFLFRPTFDTNLRDHLFIVLSGADANRYEQTFIAVMITSSALYDDDFSFHLTDEMFEKPLPKKGSHVRMHLIVLCVEKDIKGQHAINRMKPAYFKHMMDAINDLVFDNKFTPNS